MRGNLPEHLLFYERLMLEVPGRDNKVKEDAMCTGCQYHRKDFEYRYCLYTECPYVKGHKTFREEAYKIGSK